MDPLPGHPVASNVTAQVVFDNQPLNTTLDPAQYGNGLIALGTVTMYGADAGRRCALYTRKSTEEGLEQECQSVLLGR